MIQVTEELFGPDLVAWLESPEGERWSWWKHLATKAQAGRSGAFGSIFADHNHANAETGECTLTCFSPLKCYTPCTTSRTRTVGGYHIPYEPERYPGLYGASCPA